MTYYAVFQGYIVTANHDGSIPISAKIVARLDEADPDGLMARQLVDQANGMWPESGSPYIKPANKPLDPQ